MKKKTLLIGLTGGIGSGKSTVAVTLGRLGYPVLSADNFAREISAANSPALVEIEAAFGEEAISADGTMNRAFIRQQMLEDASLRTRLEQITHPRIQKLSQQRSAELGRRRAGLAEHGVMQRHQFVLQLAGAVVIALETGILEFGAELGRDIGGDRDAARPAMGVVAHRRAVLARDQQPILATGQPLA